MGRVYIVACGSSYHVGMVGKYILERLLRRPVEVVLASEFRYCDPIVDESDPGHRHQPVRRDAGHHGRPAGGQAALGARILSIVNVVGSSIARESDDVLYTWAGPEIAVATTKAYSTQLAVLDLRGPVLRRYAGHRGLGERVHRHGAGHRRRLPDQMAAYPGSDTAEIQYHASRYFKPRAPSSSSAGIWTTPWRWRAA